jgi:hypothetical protein
MLSSPSCIPLCQNAQNSADVRFVKKGCFRTVLWIRIRIIFGNPDPDPHQIKIRIRINLHMTCQNV